MHLLKRVLKVGILAVSIDPCLKIKDEYIEKKKILFELNNRHKKDNKYYNYPIDIIDELYEENSNIDINKLLISDNKIKTICNIPTYILFKPIQLYLKHINRKEDIKKGLYKYCYNNGQVSDIFYSTNGKLNGYYKTYYENGQLNYICSYTYTDDKKNGIYKRYYKNGQLYIICSYTDDERNGEYKSYHKNGQLKEICSYIDGKINGEYKKYNDNGQLEYICSYIDDKKNGEFKSYYEDGQLEVICSYTDDKMNSEFKVYYKDGQLIEY